MLESIASFLWHLFDDQDPACFRCRERDGLHAVTVTGAGHETHDPERLRLASELADMRLLQAISGQLVTEGDSAALYERIVDAAMTIMHSDFASMQMLHPDRGDGELELLAFRGFSAQAARFWKWIRQDSTTTCGIALRERRRVLTRDVQRCPVIAGTSDLDTFLADGIRSVQTTPLVSRGGKLVGMLSTHWRQPHEPSERDFGLLDILARQAADVIERNQAEQALRDSAAALREADRRKNDFLAMLAHELRNPLAPVRNVAQILRHAGSDGATIDRVAAVLERQIALMTRIVDDLLDVSRIGRGKLELRRDAADVGAIVRQAVEAVRPLCEEKRQQLGVDIPSRPMPIHADAARLTQAVGNVLSNASKFTGCGGRIRVEVDVSDTVATIRISDDGIGIAPDQMRRIFGMFEQVDTSIERAHGGLGIGLTLARTFVQVHGGTVAAHSDGRGKGSAFVIRLPIAGSTPAA